MHVSFIWVTPVIQDHLYSINATGSIIPTSLSKRYPEQIFFFFRSNQRCPRPCCLPLYHRALLFLLLQTQRSSRHPIILRSLGTPKKRSDHEWWHCRRQRPHHHHHHFKVMKRLNCSRLMTLEMLSVARRARRRGVATTLVKFDHGWSLWLWG